MHRTKPLYVSLTKTRRFVVKQLRSGLEFRKLPSTPSASVYLVPFDSARPLVESKNHRFNDHFPLRFYIPKSTNERAKKLFILINGYGEATINMWDAMADALAAQGVPSVLLPMPEHFCRNLLFNLNDFDDDPYRLVKTRQMSLSLFNKIMKFEALKRPEMFLHCNAQLMDDLAALVALVRDPMRVDPNPDPMFG